ncbi:MAG TPA: DUF1707 domain-containing protein [Streptosporangiaceae bacterium]|jgi:hypothetical protein|nr:DUF1707 domain-containing protein [Streptosporangiaceae bacterium]
MAEPGGERTAAAGGRGHLRASRTDRERVIEQLKDAFVQDRLTQEELDTRVGLALASRTYADLADLTADIPVGSAAAEPATAGPAAEPAGSPARTLAKAARRSGICMLAAFALVGVVVLTQSGPLTGMAFLSALIAALAASGFLGYGVVDAWHERRSRRQLPPAPRRDGRRFQGGRPGSTGHDPPLPRDRPDQARADMRSDSSRPGRPHSSGRGGRAPRATRLVPDAV